MLLELAERCEKASGPDWSLNFAIGEALGHKTGVYDPESPGRIAFTNSIDDALALVPEGGWWELDANGSATVVVEVRLADLDDVEYDRETCKGQAATPALALCAAALRARAASVDRSPQGGDRETGRHAKHESAVPSEASADAPPSAPSLQTPQGGDS